MEKFDIIDINREKIGREARRGSKLKKGEYFLSVHVWIVNSRGEILLQRRSPDKTVCPNLWSVCGGGVLSGETSYEAAKREVLEEIGIDINGAAMEPVGRAQEPDEWGSLVDVWLVKSDFPISEVEFQLSEVCDAKWADLAEITRLVEEGKFAPNVLFALDMVVDNCGLR